MKPVTVRRRTVALILLLLLLLLLVLGWLSVMRYRSGDTRYTNEPPDDFGLPDLERAWSILDWAVASLPTTNTDTDSERPCPLGQFRLHTGAICEASLSCDEIAVQVTVGEPLAIGGVKRLFRATFRGTPVVLAKAIVMEDFMEGVRNLLVFGANSSLAVQPLGACLATATIVTPFYARGSLLDVWGSLPPGPESWPVRLRMVTDYLRIMVFMHNSPIGTRVFCDTNSVEKLFMQLLVRDDGALVLNDVDAIPLADRHTNILVKCGHRQLRRDHHPFIAPEQEWPFPNQPFSDEAMPGYDEKIDVWRVPDTLSALLKIDIASPPTHATAVFHHWVARLASECQARDPRRRPTMTRVLREWRLLLANQHTTRLFI